MNWEGLTALVIAIASLATWPLTRRHYRIQERVAATEAQTKAADSGVRVVEAASAAMAELNQALSVEVKRLADRLESASVRLDECEFARLDLQQKMTRMETALERALERIAALSTAQRRAKAAKKRKKA